ncbi:Pkinase-domain-containing protein [Myriangium duriaei CBS 260.36]|uniref:non-specific serine/threonine protein kinase n=1 Tax=Myriangium duriaei CBS 260.36 TaxID=1168546 RepID=A0A9P4IYS5_9PEZI|nr:Pkinase-domain-containing protein [Myriangium duriaei CBS 260.36]
MSQIKSAGQQGEAAVRFASRNEEISPATSLSPVQTMTGADGRGERELNPEAQEEIKQLKSTLQQHVQSKRLEQFSFEPVSLPGSQPVSRVPSSSNLAGRRLPAGSIGGTPKPSPPQSAVHSPPLTPASTGREGRPPTSIPSISLAQRARAQADVVTPQRSSSPEVKARSRPTSVSDEVSAVSSQPRPGPRFSIGPSHDSEPPSEDQSPAVTPGVSTPGTTTPSAVPTSRQTSLSAPSEDDLEIRTKKATPPRPQDTVEARFRFGNRDPRHGYSTSTTNVTLGQPNLSAASLTGPGAGSLISNPSGATTPPIHLKPEDKRMSFFGKSHSDDSEKKGSSSNLKRFFKFGGHHKHKEKKAHSPGPEGVSTTNAAVPFADDHGLESKYGKFGKVLGSGAGGSVRIMKRSADSKTFAVKQFRNRHPYESEKEYNKKVTSEFCIGSTLHHGNIIETIDIIHEKGNWFEVMEYAPYDLFATVMTGKMGRDEVTCCTLQILSGVTYLHSMGLAHRDLKLDNVVINEHGIMKIIDFGSAVVFRYPFEDDIVLSTGVVGSDPYLAPEVYDNTRYDPQLADIWSIAIIFCCMCLRRFPWKAPRMSDNSYRLFVSPPDPGQDELLASSGKSSVASSRAPSNSDSASESKSGHHHHHHHHHSHKEEKPAHPTGNEAQQIKGPIRLLRLLPRDTRQIIGRMLEIDPRKRATMDEILENEWVQNALVCKQEEGGVCYHAPNHRHHLEGSGQSLVISSKK